MNSFLAGATATAVATGGSAAFCAARMASQRCRSFSAFSRASADWARHAWTCVSYSVCHSGAFAGGSSSGMVEGEVGVSVGPGAVLALDKSRPSGMMADVRREGGGEKA